jgi:hypothetical protein
LLERSGAGVELTQPGAASPADLKNVSDPGTVTYTIDGATILLQKK